MHVFPKSLLSIAIIASSSMLVGCGGGGTKPQVNDPVVITNPVTIINQTDSTRTLTETELTNTTVLSSTTLESNVLGYGQDANGSTGKYYFDVVQQTLEHTHTTTTYEITERTTEYSDGSTDTVELSRTILSQYDTTSTENRSAENVVASREDIVIGTPNATGLATSRITFEGRDDVDLSLGSNYDDALIATYGNQTQATLDYYSSTYGNNLLLVDAPAAWSKGWMGDGVTVSVLDTGIDTDHQEFAGKIVGTKCFITDCGYGSSNAEDDNGHGTHVAGIIAAKLDGVGTTGVAPNANLMAAKIGNASGSVWDSQFANAIDWSLQNGADIVNISANVQYTQDYFDGLVEASDGTLYFGDAASTWRTQGYGNYLLNDYQADIANALNAGDGLLVVSAGNQGQAIATFPAQFVHLDGGTLGEDLMNGRMLVVGSFDPATGDLASYSNAAGTVCFDYNAATDTCNTPYRMSEHFIMAPGSYMASTLHDGGYSLKSGTSMATPTVSGGAALIRQMWPHVPSYDIANILLMTANTDEITNYDPDRHGVGLMDLDAATNPIGTLTVPQQDAANAATAERVTPLTNVGTIATAGMNISALNSVMTLDTFDRDFYVNANATTAKIDTRKRSFVKDSARNTSPDNSFMGMTAGFDMIETDKVTVRADEDMNLNINYALNDVAYVGVMHESDTFLGNYADSTLMRVDGAQTAYAGVQKAFDLDNGVTLFGDASVGMTRLEVGRDSYLSDADTLLTNSVNVGAKWNVGKTANMGLTLSMPVAVISGKADFTMPTSVSADGSINSSTISSSLSQSEREVDLGVFYNLTEIEQASGAVLSLNAVAEKRFSAGNVNGNDEVNARLNATLRF